jgi:hypothetical protein
VTFFRPLWGAKIRASPIDGVWVYGVFPGLLLTPRFNEEIETQRRLEPFLTGFLLQRLIRHKGSRGIDYLKRKSNLKL